MVKRVSVTRAHWQRNRWHLLIRTENRSVYERLIIPLDASLAEAIEEANRNLESRGLSAEWVTRNPRRGQPHAVAATLTVTKTQEVIPMLT